MASRGRVTTPQQEQHHPQLVPSFEWNRDPYGQVRADPIEVPDIALKVLRADGSPTHAPGDFRWPLPTDTEPGEWVEVEGTMSMCRTGLHFTDFMNLMSWMVDRGTVYILESASPVVLYNDGKYLTNKARLLKRIPDEVVHDTTPRAKYDYWSWDYRHMRQAHINRLRGELLAEFGDRIAAAWFTIKGDKLDSLPPEYGDDLRATPYGQMEVRIGQLAERINAQRDLIRHESEGQCIRANLALAPDADTATKEALYKSNFQIRKEAANALESLEAARSVLYGLRRTVKTDIYPLEVWERDYSGSTGIPGWLPKDLKIEILDWADAHPIPGAEEIWQNDVEPMLVREEADQKDEKPSYPYRAVAEYLGITVTPEQQDELRKRSGRGPVTFRDFAEQLRKSWDQDRETQRRNALLRAETVKYQRERMRRGRIS